MSELSITMYTDPLCVWCYAQEPALRMLLFNTNDAVKIHYVMGLMAPDEDQIDQDDEGQPGHFEAYRAAQEQAVDDALHRISIPFDTQRFNECTASQLVSLTPSLAFEAMKLIDEDTANRFLFRMRAAFMAQGMDITKQEVINQLASEFGVDMALFEKNLASGAAQELLDADQERVHRFGIRSMPQTDLEYDDHCMRAKGLIPYERLVMLLQELMGNGLTIPPRESTFENHLALVRRFGWVTPVEMQMAFYLSRKRLYEVTQELEAYGAIKVVEAGNGYFLVAQ